MENYFLGGALFEFQNQSSCSLKATLRSITTYCCQAPYVKQIYETDLQLQILTQKQI